MKKNIFFLALALFGITLSLDAAKKTDQKAEDKNIKLVRPASSSSSSSSSTSSSLSGDEKVEIAPYFSIYRDLEKNDLKLVKQAIATTIWDAAESKDYKSIMDLKGAVAELDPDDIHTLINPVVFYKCAVKAYIDKEQGGFLDRVKDMIKEEYGLFSVEKCSDPETILDHVHTIFYYQRQQDGNLIFVRQKETTHGPSAFMAMMIDMLAMNADGPCVIF